MAEEPQEPTPAQAPAAVVTFRLPRIAYLIVLLLLVGTVPLALSTDGGHGVSELTNSSNSIGGFGVTPLAVLLLIPVLALIFIRRTATFVGPEGIRVRALFGSRTMAWSTVRGLSVGERTVYAVLDGGAVRLPCVRVAHLHDIAEASGGRLPEIPRAKVKHAPSRTRR